MMISVDDIAYDDEKETTSYTRLPDFYWLVVIPEKR